MSAYRNDFDATKYMTFLITDDQLLKNIMRLKEKVKNIIKKELESQPVYNEKYLKTKIKSHNGIISTNFHNNKIQEEGSQLIY